MKRSFILQVLCDGHTLHLTSAKIDHLKIAKSAYHENEILWLS